jgi:hypothetical protein
MKTLIALVVCLLIPFCVFAASLDESSVIFLCSSVTATGDCASDGIDIGFQSSKFRCWVSFAGTAPTSVIIKLKGAGALSDVYSTDVTHTVTYSDTDSWSFLINKSLRFIKGNYTSKVGGDGTTAVTLKCRAGGN